MKFQNRSDAPLCITGVPRIEAGAIYETTDPNEIRVLRRVASVGEEDEQSKIQVKPCETCKPRHNKRSKKHKHNEESLETTEESSEVIDEN